jgi:hypothetical protein
VIEENDPAMSNEHQLGAGDDGDKTEFDREAAEARGSALDHALDELQAEAAKYPKEWWDEFERDLQANRLNFEERVIKMLFDTDE